MSSLQASVLPYNEGAPRFSEPRRLSLAGVFWGLGYMEEGSKGSGLGVWGIGLKGVRYGVTRARTVAASCANSLTPQQLWSWLLHGHVGLSQGVLEPCRKKGIYVCIEREREFRA